MPRRNLSPSAVGGAKKPRQGRGGGAHVVTRKHRRSSPVNRRDPPPTAQQTTPMEDSLTARVEEAVVAKLGDIIKQQVAAALAEHKSKGPCFEAGVEPVASPDNQASTAPNPGPRTTPGLSLGQLVNVGTAPNATRSTALQTQAQGPGTNLLTLPAEMVAGSAYPFPLDARVSDKIRAKIISRQFINFADLLDPSRADKSQLTLQTGANGEVLFYKEQTPTSFKQTVKSIVDWDAAFAIYTTVYTAAFPNETAQLIKYGERVKRLARQGGDWAHYDVGFRCLRQSTPVPWDYLQEELYMEALTHKLKSSGESFQGGKPMYIPKGYCTRYHRGNSCSGCNYKHHCFKCSEGVHPATKCKRQKPGTGGSQRSAKSDASPSPASTAHSSGTQSSSSTPGRVRLGHN